MKRLTRYTLIFAMLALSWLGMGAAQAQVPGPGGSPAVSAALLKVLGNFKAFTANAETQVLDSQQQELLAVPMYFAWLEGKIRVEIDQTQIRSASMPPGTASTLKRMGMSQVISIVRPDQKQVHVLYPGAKAVLTMALPPDATGAEPTRKPQGEETIEGHLCVKNLLILKNDRGQDMEVITWNAKDLQDFPLQIQTREGGTTSIVKFRQVRFDRPEASQFNPPASYTEYKSPQELLRGVMKAFEGGNSETGSTERK
jgi:hypothetical protein